MSTLPFRVISVFESVAVAIVGVGMQSIGMKNGHFFFRFQ